MPDSRQLLKAAYLLLSEADGPVTDACIRRAISTTYYAMFHDVVRSATDQFVGRDNRGSPGYAIIYRAFSHTKMKGIFYDLDRDRLSPKYHSAMGRKVISPDLRWFASYFIELQQKRNIADYDPNICFTRSEAVAFIFDAEMSLGIFEQSAAEERVDVLALLLVTLRD